MRSGDGGQGSFTGPQFGETESTVSVSAGKTASLPCVVHHLSDKSVTWLRRRDLHILTVGLQTYSADDRFKVIHREGSDEWTLLVRYAQPRDAGIYDCQINTDPKISHPVTLRVVLDTSGKEAAPTKTKVFVANNTASTSDGDLRVEIQGPRELYIEEGSSLSLTCLVTSSNGPSTLVYWYHNTNLIDYNSPRGGVNLKIDRGRGQTITHLLVSSVGQGDSGMYSCVPTGSHPATVRVHVNQGENEAAIQQGGLDETSCASCPRSFQLLPLLLLPCCLLFGLQNVSFKPSIAYLKTLIVSLLYKILFVPILASASSDGNEVYPSSSPSLCSFPSLFLLLLLLLLVPLPRGGTLRRSFVKGRRRARGIARSSSVRAETEAAIEMPLQVKLTRVAPSATNGHRKTPTEEGGQFEVKRKSRNKKKTLKPVLLPCVE
ncbi:uncharacterized protein LOC135227010 isoform X2 [Macrobrachium nipponense]|uniref:uncharacterized protein LOC135227010 isoform X2 n=1 Tax=Macrobrachium nipponense TaxID=159736 RepID=UPI0030C7A663